jgi:hypothetical protein
MSFGKPTVFVGVAVAAAAPMLLHGHPTRDCSPRMELCAPSDAVHLPDENAPEHAPQLIVAPPVATTSASAASTTAMTPFWTFKS